MQIDALAPAGVRMRSAPLQKRPTGDPEGNDALTVASLAKSQDSPVCQPSV